MRFILGLFLCVVGSSLFAQKIDFAVTRHDFGRIKEVDGAVYYDFYFMNTGNKPLVINSVLVSCGCTTSEWSKQAIAPGEKGLIRVGYHPEGRREQRFNAIAEVYTNSVNYGTHKGVHNLEILGRVERKAAVPALDYRVKRQTPSVEKEPKREVKDDFDRILTQIRGWILKGVEDSWKQDEKVDWMVKTMKRGGFWPDLDYACYFRTNWEVVEHLGRLKNMAIAYTDVRSGFYQQDSLFVAISDGLNYWNRRDPKSHNWWFNQIAASQSLGDILVLMHFGKQALPEALKSGLMKKMERSDPRKWTGANKLDIALHTLSRGVLLDNDSIVKLAVREAFYPIRITKEEGMQEDGSYHQHGSQLYVGGYGVVFIDGEVKMARLVEGTSFALKEDQLKLFSEFVRGIFLHVLRGPYIDFSVTGRGISRAGILDYQGVVRILKDLAEIDPLHAAEYKAAIVRLEQPGKAAYQRVARNRMYWRSDYMLHNRKAYDFSVRTASVRTRKTESGNGDNLLGVYLSEGATNIRVNGNEYFDVFPVWEWDKIPGITAPEGEVKMGVVWGAMGKSVFTGGVSDGQYGVMAFDMNDFDVRARKAWFMFDEEVVCLGAGICASVGVNINTAVNQCRGDGDVVVSRGGVISSLKDSLLVADKALDWIWHDSVAYLFPGEQEVRLKNGTQRGSWDKINYNYPAEEVTERVFNLWISHGGNPQGAKYAYVVVPGVANVKDMSCYERENIEILRNDAVVQAVLNKKLGILQAVFYQPEKLMTVGGELTVNVPCVLMIKGVGGRNPEILVTDPTQRREIVIDRDVVFSTKK